MVNKDARSRKAFTTEDAEGAEAAEIAREKHNPLSTG